MLNRKRYLAGKLGEGMTTRSEDSHGSASSRLDLKLRPESGERGIPTNPPTSGKTFGDGRVGTGELSSVGRTSGRGVWKMFCPCNKKELGPHKNRNKPFVDKPREGKNGGNQGYKVVTKGKAIGIQAVIQRKGQSLYKRSFVSPHHLCGPAR